MSAELLSRAAAERERVHMTQSKIETYPVSMGVDEEKLKEYLADYTNWMNRLE